MSRAHCVLQPFVMQKRWGLKDMHFGMHEHGEAQEDQKLRVCYNADCLFRF